ncbi:hypothetical protein ACFV1L_20165 [Kitasatospora sp. NPDC059646]|uniref:hypothetical protein n=1 Tax=Kitasatospora sp. NPDC059646 TaxID=3346893 RepID=UPI00368316C4
MSGGDQFTFNAPITQSVIGGTGNVQHNCAGPAADQTPAVRELAAQLARLVQQEAPELAPTADAVHGELARAEDEGRDAEPGRLRGWLELIVRGVTAGGAAATAAEGLLRALGL